MKLNKKKKILPLALFFFSHHQLILSIPEKGQKEGVALVTRVLFCKPVSKLQPDSHHKQQKIEYNKNVIIYKKAKIINKFSNKFSSFLIFTS